MSDSSPRSSTTAAAFTHMQTAFRGLQTVQVVSLGLKLGLFASLQNEGAASWSSLAERLALHPPYVRVWCEVGYAFGILEIDANDQFTLAPGMGTVLLDGDHPRYLGGFAAGFTDILQQDFDRYPAAFKDGGVFPFHAHGEAFSAWVASLTHPMQRLVVGRVLPEYFGAQLGAGIDILDIGCGAGNLIFKLAGAYPKCHFTGIDVDAHGIALARQNATAGSIPNVTFEHLSGEIFTRKSAFDLALMFEVLHEIPVADRTGVLASAYRALRPGGALFILDETWADDPHALRQPQYAMSILVQFSELIWGNIVATEREQTVLLNEAGFTTIQRADFGEAFTLIVARKA